MSKELRCPDPNCSTLFGKQDDDTLSIKNRDMFRHFEGGRAWGPCRGCGKTIIWSARDGLIDDTRA